MVFIMDSMEKVNPPLGKFREVMESVFRVLSQESHHLRLPDCHSIYTVPPYVQLVNAELSQHYDQLTPILPAVKVRERGIAVRSYDPGINTLIELVKRRIPIDRVFGPHQDRLARLIEYSGGHVRTLIFFLRKLLMRANRKGLPPSVEDVEWVVQPFRENARMKIGPAAAGLLDSVIQEGTIDGIAERDYGLMADLMDNYLVLCYRNAGDWYEVHPLARDHVLRLAAKARGEQQP